MKKYVCFQNLILGGMVAGFAASSMIRGEFDALITFAAVCVLFSGLMMGRDLK